MQVENVASYGPTIFKTKGCRLAFIISVMLFLSVIFLKISANLSLPWLRCQARGKVKVILKKNEKTARSREAIPYINTAYLTCLRQKQLDEG